MYEISDKIVVRESKGLQVQKLVDGDACEILGITMKKKSTFPEHSSPRNTNLSVLGGTMIFYINGESYHLKKQQLFNFPKAKVHSVFDDMDPKFVIIR